MKKFNLKEYQTELKKMLSRVDVVLTKASIPYTIAYGSLLGAIREGDIIPWDDDVDIYIKRKDYDKARSVIRTQCPNFYVWDWENDEKCDLSFARVFNRLRGGETVEFYRAYIDIYVMDDAPDCVFLQKLSAVIWVAIRRLINLRSGHKICWSRTSLKSCAFYVFMVPFLLFRVSKLKKIFNVVRGRFFSTGKYVWYESCGRKTVFPAAGIDNPVRVKFGDLELLAPSSYLELLEMCYGDWKTPPADVADRGQHAYTNDGIELATRPDDDKRRL